jgi:fumarate reductase (CoM/CoB) subunit A
LEILTTDILVIGGGGAGSRAAYEAKREDPRLKVTLVMDGRWGACGSTCFSASEALGINAPLNMAVDGDSPEIFFQDILETGLGLSDPKLAQHIAYESVDRIRELIDLGVRFDLDGGKIHQKKLSGCSKARSLSQGGRTGIAIVATLKKAALKLGVEAIEGVRIIDLIAHEGKVWGAIGIHHGKEIGLLARAVILACGGAGRIFPRNINPPSLQGDGFAMAYRAGAILTNTEFIQIGPGVVYPKMKFIIHSHIWNFHPILRNGLGKEFLEVYLPPGISKDEVLSLKSMSFPFSVRTAARYVDIAISKEIYAGRGTSNGGVFLMSPMYQRRCSRPNLKLRFKHSSDTA